MEKYRIGWIPSQSDFVESRDVFAKENGGPTITVATGLPSSSNQIDANFTTGASVEVWTVVHGDNGTQAESFHLSFNAVNTQSVQPDTGLTATWLSHVP
jgi:hypothetical protein